MRCIPAAAILLIFPVLPIWTQSVDSIPEIRGQVAEPIPEDLDPVADTLFQPDTMYLIQVPPDWDTSYFFPGDPGYNLIQAADRGHLPVVKMLVESGAPLEATTLEGVTPLMYAAQQGDLEMVQYLVEKGADVNARPYNGISPLIGAARSGNYEIARYLLESGAEVDQQDETDLTALTHASAYNARDIVTLLAGHGADLESRDWYGTTPLMTAVYYNCYESARELVRLGAEVNAQDTFGFTPLMIAAQHGDYDIAWMLLDRGADPSVQNNSGHHALSMAVMYGKPDIIELLLESGARLNQNITPAANAINLAYEMKKDTMVNYLKQLGAIRNLSPEFSGIRFSSSWGFNTDDFNVRFTGGITEGKFRSYATTGFEFRPRAVRILREVSDTLSYQYWERRYSWPVTLGKQFRIIRVDGKNYGLRLQLSGMLTWGGYRGSDSHPGVRYLFSPAAGFYWRERFYGISFDYEYANMKVFQISPHRFRLGLEFFIDTRKRNKFTYKHIDWF